MGNSLCRVLVISGTGDPTGTGEEADTADEVNTSMLAEFSISDFHQYTLDGQDKTQHTHPFSVKEYKSFNVNSVEIRSVLAEMPGVAWRNLLDRMIYKEDELARNGESAMLSELSSVDPPVYGSSTSYRMGVTTARQPYGTHYSYKLLTIGESRADLAAATSGNFKVAFKGLDSLSKLDFVDNLALKHAVWHCYGPHHILERAFQVVNGVDEQERIYNQSLLVSNIYTTYEEDCKNSSGFGSLELVQPVAGAPFSVLYVFPEATYCDNLCPDKPDEPRAPAKSVEDEGVFCLNATAISPEKAHFDLHCPYQCPHLDPEVLYDSWALPHGGWANQGSCSTSSIQAAEQYAVQILNRSRGLSFRKMYAIPRQPPQPRRRGDGVDTSHLVTIILRFASPSSCSNTPATNYMTRSCPALNYTSSRMDTSITGKPPVPKTSSGALQAAKLMSVRRTSLNGSASLLQGSGSYITSQNGFCVDPAWRFTPIISSSTSTRPRRFAKWHPGGGKAARYLQSESGAPALSVFTP
ncbi:hypothetical protein BJ508DRAFT_367435 [Ascobolus immersus RN42]|uniref:Uncharacterized protein n=1 Tax=Ascobolus immersus RN42 TaxID=1160509 RepID=A0A3N4HR25_ASCIM|nr:hypothetical protein BJ508DRAFT_367435 [Ascobolus immersus RN42]